VSGASGLIYQISWIRLLSLTFGVTMYAVSAVVAAFMGGLALGSLVGGRLADRVRRPILWYAGAELVIAVLGRISPWALDGVQAAYLAAYPRGGEDAALGVVALRFALAAVVLLIPATLMGATLPLMVKGSLSLGRSIGPRVSWLYAANTTGAILGTIAAGFVLIGTLGISATIAVAAGLNAAAAVAALGVASAFRSRPRSDEPEANAPHEAATGPSDDAVSAGPWVRPLVMIAFAVQGLASLAYEVIWTRILAILLDGTTYAFSIVLAIVLLGIAVGSALVSPLMTRNLPWVRIYTLIQAGVAALALLGIVEFARIHGIMDRIELLSGPLRPLVERHYGWMIGVPLVAILPPMVLLGASFPVAARIVVSGTRNAGRDLGILYGGNTAGAILGSWVAGFFLLPALGSQAAIVVLSLVNVALAVALALASGPGRFYLVTTVVVMFLAAFAAMVALAPNMYHRVVSSRFPDHEILWVGEGQETSVSVVRDNAIDALRMHMNGQHQAGDEPNMVTFHRLLGHLPMIVHPDPQDVLIVGLGGGVTAGALSRHEPRRLDVVELSDTVVHGSRYFRHVNADILSYPNLHLRIDDGRNHLLLTDRKYDVITADVIHPRNAGSAVLYSKEYYELARRALKPGGIMVQWLEDRPENPDNVTQRKLMARTFLSTFPHVTLWVYGALMIGSNDAITIDEHVLADRWERRNFDRSLPGTGLEWPASIMSFANMSDPELREWSEYGRNPSIMSDDHPYVEYFLSLPGGRGVGRRGAAAN
jgi:spermidine synthase